MYVKCSSDKLIKSIHCLYNYFYMKTRNQGNCYIIQRELKIKLT